MAKDAWTTGEVETWLLNDEDLYTSVIGTAKRWGKKPSVLRLLLRERCEVWAREGRLGDLNVTAMRRVDWDQVQQTIWEAAKEETSDG